MTEFRECKKNGGVIVRKRFVMFFAEQEDNMRRAGSQRHIFAGFSTSAFHSESCLICGGICQTYFKHV